MTTDREAAFAFLTQRINYERTNAIPYGSREFKLDRMRELMRRLGNPQLRLRIVHIAGTKGKGSTAAMIASVLQTADYRVGLYTSPHLERLDERFLINGALCSESELVAAATQVAAVVAEMDAAQREGESNDLRPTYFEITTALAMLLFERCEVDLAVLEVGLGGRLDSTNVCRPLVSVITSISLDHTKQLGDTVASIAREKAGIIKRDVPLVCGARDPAAREVIVSQAQQLNAPLMLIDEHFHFRCRPHSLDTTCGTSLDYWETSYRMMDTHVPLLGTHQSHNAAIAIATCRTLRKLGYSIGDTAVREGIAAAECRARIEVISREPWIVIDAAHNVASVEALVETLDPLLTKLACTLIFSTSKDKDVEGMLRVLLPRFSEVICTNYLNNPRAVAAESAARLANQIVDSERVHDRPMAQVTHAETPTEAWNLAWQKHPDLICISGSFFLAAELRRTALATLAEHSMPAKADSSQATSKSNPPDKAPPAPSGQK